jgi:hypothetical protein
VGPVWDGGGVPGGGARGGVRAVGNGRARRKQAPIVRHMSRGGGGPIRWAPPGREEGGVGRAWKTWASRGEGKWARPEETVKVSIYSNNFQTSSNYFDQKMDLPSSKYFK